MDRSNCPSHKTRNINEFLHTVAAVLIILWVLSKCVEKAVHIWKIVEVHEAGVAQAAVSTDVPTPTETPSPTDTVPPTEVATAMSPATLSPTTLSPTTLSPTSISTATPDADATATAEMVSRNVEKSFDDLSATALAREETDSVTLTHTIRNGELLACIGEYYYGSQDYFDELCAYNELGDCHRLNIDDIIRLPASLLVQRRDRRYDIVPYTGRVQPEGAIACE